MLIQNLTETVVSQLSNGTSVVDYRIQVGARNTTFEQLLPNSSLIFPYLNATTLMNPNATITQVTRSFNLTFINSTRTSVPFSLTQQVISFNGSSYSGNLYTGRIAATVNLTAATNSSLGGPLIPFNVDVKLQTFPSDLLYNLTASSVFTIPVFAEQGSTKFQMTLLSTNLSLGDEIQPLTAYIAAILIASVGVGGYILLRRRRAARRLSEQASKKPDYWVH